jgi:hypothetical protein
MNNYTGDDMSYYDNLKIAVPFAEAKPANTTRNICKQIIIIILAIMTISGTLAAQVSPIENKGGADSVIYKGDTIMIENTLLDQAVPIPPSGTFSAGLTFMYSEYMKLLYFPLQYSINDIFAVDLTLPYYSKKMIDTYDVERDKGGFGDLKLGGTASYKIASIDALSSLKVAFPTGDQSAMDGDFNIPMGNGSYNLSLLQSMSIALSSRIPFRLFFNTGAVYYSRSRWDYNATMEYQIDHTYALSALFGAEYSPINNMTLQLKANIIYVPERRIRIQSTESGYSSSWLEFNDGIIGSDMIAAINYRFPYKLLCHVLFVLPIYEKHDEDVSEKSWRKWKLDFGITREFSSTPDANIKTRK